MLNFFENDPVLSCFAYICSTERRVHFSQHELENCGNRDDQTVGVTKHAYILKASPMAPTEPEKLEFSAIFFAENAQKWPKVDQI